MKLVLWFAAVVVLTAAVSLVIGTRRIGDAIFAQAQGKVVHDLATARLVYRTALDGVRSVVMLTSERTLLADAVNTGRWEDAQVELERVRTGYELDYLSVVDRQGRVVMRSSSPYDTGDDLSQDPVVRTALAGGIVASTEILPKDRLDAEGSGLGDQAHTELLDTLHAAPRDAAVETVGMVLCAAAPILDRDGQVAGALYGGLLLNRRNTLVDEIRDTVYKGETYDGMDVGTSTIFLGDVRIATNVRDENDVRAIGTRVSAEVQRQVLIDGAPWNDRAFVVNEWYITAYEPIRTATDGRVVGMLYVGMLERPFVDMRDQVIVRTVRDALIFGVGSALLIAIFLARRLSGPITKVARASEAISRGDFSQWVEATSGDEIGALGSSFNRMSRTLERTLAEKDASNEELRKLNTRYLDLLGFVTHELAQPLGVLRGYLTLMRDQTTGALDPPAQAKATKAMLSSTETMVEMSKTYLSHSRVESSELQLHVSSTRLYEDVIRPAAEMMEQRLLERKMRLRFENEPALKEATLDLDATLMRVVYTNLLDNAIKYGRSGGEIACGYSVDEDGHWLNVWNEGDGIPADKLDVVFEKFVRFRIPGGGAGLGLFNTKTIVERHSGTIWAESQEGEWANFVILFPRKMAQGDDSSEASLGSAERRAPSE